MTGIVFGSICKYLEIGIIVDKGINHNNSCPPNVQETHSKKRINKANEKEANKHSQQTQYRNIKHFSAV
jgi:hypothetical protein